MAIVLAFAGSILGMGAATLALLLLDVGLLLALGIWSGTGAVFTLAGVGLAHLPRATPTCQQTRTA